jgi:hypothetical protein
VFDESSLYLGVHCEDSTGARDLHVRDLRRDFDDTTDDFFGIAIDGVRAERSALVFELALSVRFAISRRSTAVWPMLTSTRSGRRVHRGTRTDGPRDYPWPGNIRELQNVIERAVIVSDTNTLSLDERWLVRQRVVEPDAQSPLDDDLTAYERSRVEASLAASKAASTARLGRRRDSESRERRSNRRFARSRSTSIASEAMKRSDGTSHSSWLRDRVLSLDNGLENVVPDPMH